MFTIARILATLAAAGTVVSADGGCRNFIASCSTVKVTGGDDGSPVWLSAKCRHPDGHQEETSIDISTKFSFTSGDLERNDLGGFAKTCRNLDVYNGELSATCRDEGGFGSPKINLNAYICNVDGKMQF